MNTDALQIPPAAPVSAFRMTARRVGAVFAGLFAIFAVTTATDVVLHATGLYPAWNVRMSDGLFVLAAAYRVVYGIGGCWLTARLAPDHPTRHAFVLGAIGVVLSIAGALYMGDRGPAWYALAVIAMSLPCAWAGAKLHRSDRA
jgi:hypothetical protein